MRKILCVLLMAVLICPALAETVQDQALAFIQDAGIAADAVSRIDNRIVIPLLSGGTASLWTNGDFDPYDLSWRFEDASDADVAAYLDHALSILAALERKIPADTTGLSAVEQRRAEGYAVMVSNGLLELESLEQQGLNILLEKLAAHDDSGLNSLRARLAARLLGELGHSPVDPGEGCAWYDALTLTVQEDLPPTDSAMPAES